MKKSTDKNGILRYIVISTVIFICAIIVSIITRAILTSDIRLMYFDSEQTSLVAAIMGSAVSALAAGFVLKQLKSEEMVRIKENKIHEAEFYQHFVQYWLDTDKIFVENPQCRKYFYDNADVTVLPPGSDEFQKVMAIAEYFDDLLRYSETELEKDVYKHVLTWEERDSYNKYIAHMRERPVMKVFADRYGPWVNYTVHRKNKTDLR